MLANLTVKIHAPNLPDPRDDAFYILFNLTTISLQLILPYNLCHLTANSLHPFLPVQNNCTIFAWTQNHCTLFCRKTKQSPCPKLPDCQLAQILCLEPPGSISEESPFRFSPGKLQQIIFFIYEVLSFFGAPFSQKHYHPFIFIPVAQRRVPSEGRRTKTKPRAYQCSE
jgi:hypothetical protein